MGFGGQPVPVKRALESGSCGGGAWRLAGWRLTGLSPQASGGLADVRGPRENDVHRVGVAEIGFWPFWRWVVGEGYFILLWLFIEGLFGLSKSMARARCS